MKRTTFYLPLVLTFLALGTLLFSFVGSALAFNPPPPAEMVKTGQAAPVLMAPNLPAEDGAVIAFFDDPAYVDTTNSIYAESDNMQAGLAGMGHTVVPFTGIDAAAWSAALQGADVLVIPMLENGPYMGDDLSPEAIAVIETFVERGGGLIVSIFGNYFINSVFGFELYFYGMGSPSSITPAADGTAFMGGPADLPLNVNTTPLYADNFPPGSAVIYTHEMPAAEVALFPYGNGQIVYLGWDWFNAVPVGTQDGGWLDVLGRAVDQVDVDSLGLFPPEDRGYGAPAALVTFNQTLFNGTGLTDTFTLELSSSAWPTSLEMETTPLLADGAQLDFGVDVAIPAQAALGSSDTVIVTATSVTNPTQFTATSTLTTYAICGDPLSFSGRSQETIGDLDDVWDFGSQTFGVVKISVASDNTSRLNAVLSGYSPTNGWVELAQQTAGSSGVLFDAVLLPANYTQLRVQLDDTSNWPLIHYDYEFLVCRSEAVDLNPNLLQENFGGVGTSVEYAYTLTNYMQAPAQFDLAVSGTTWPTSVRDTGGAPITQTPLLADLEDFTFTVRVDIPADAVLESLDGGTLTVSHTGLPVTSDIGTFQTKALSGQFGYVLGTSDNLLRVMDTVLHKEVGTISTLPGSSPTYGELTPDGSQLYVSLSGSGEVLVLDTATRLLLARIPVTDTPSKIAFSPDGAYAFVTDQNTAEITVIDTAALAVSTSLLSGVGIYDIATSACLDKAYVTNRFDNSVSVIDTLNLTVDATIPGFSQPYGAVVSPFGNWVYVVNMYGSISVIDTASDTVIATWKAPAQWVTYIDVSPDGRTLYVVSQSTDAVYVLDAFSGELIKTLDISVPAYVEFFPASAGSLAYITQAWSVVHVVDTVTHSVVDTVEFEGGVAQSTALFPMADECITDGMVVAPTAKHQMAVAGQATTFHPMVINLTGITQAFTLTVSDIPWTTALTTMTTGPLAHGETFVAEVTVEVPADAPYGALQTVVFTASGPHGMQDSASLTASAMRPGFVMNREGNLIHVVDTFTHMDSGIAIDVSAYGDGPYRGTLSPDGTQLYVGLRYSDNLLIVDTNTLTPTAVVPVGDGLHDVAFSPDGSKAFVSNRDTGELTVINTSVLTDIITITVGTEPMGMAVSKRGELFVALRRDGAVAVVDTETLAVITTITGFAGPHGLVYSPVGNRVYVTNQDDSTIGVIDAGSHTLVDTWPVPNAEWLADIDSAWHGRRLYVADANSGATFVIDTASGEVLAEVNDMGQTAWEVEVFATDAGPYVYVTFPFEGKVGVLNSVTNTFVKYIELGPGGDLRGMALFPPTQPILQVFLPLARR